GLNDFLDHEDSDIKNIDAGTVDTSSFMNKYTTGAGFKAGVATCPAPYTVDVVITTFTLDLTPFCDLATVIRWFMVAFATVGAGLMIAKYS
ncbi:virulence factor TspB C-terminal domain-related protein, partial [Shewanella sp.]|uniref:virulence factor TspB C-terminal domain-related protein n=1 Tax=Shewanella sp. TaxID=50422 RepID=UPI002585C6C0